LRQCFNTNDDGAGFCYNNGDGSIILKKGFFSFKKLWRAVREIPTASELIIHCRIATHGTINASNCHPFTTAQGFAIAHNGIINGYGDKTKSDTMDFIESIINNISSRDDIARVLTATATRTR
jgi:predicted glutamine amidotransferase